MHDTSDINREPESANARQSHAAPNLLAELRQDLRMERFLPALLSGLIIGATMVLWSVTIAALIFNGPLEASIARGTGYFLFGSMVLAIVMALMSSYPGMIAASDEAAIIILSLIASATAAALLPSVESEMVFTTVMMIVALTTLLCGFVFLGLGRFRLGNLVRFIPYPVIGGVVVTMGWLIIVGAFGVMTDADVEIDTLLSMLEPENLVRWLPGTVFAVSLVAATRFSTHYLVLPAMFAVAIVLFYVVTGALGMSVDELESTG